MESSKSNAAFGQKTDITFWISVGVGFALVGAMGVAQYVSKDAVAAAKPVPSVQAKASTADPVYQCNGRVSFKPCS